MTLAGLGVAADRIFLDKGLTGAGPASTRPSQAVRAGDTLVVPELDRLARSVPDARDIGDSLVNRGVRLSLGGTIYAPADPLGKMFFKRPRHLRRIRGRPTPATHPRRDAVARAKGKLRGKQPKHTTRQQRELVRRRRACGRKAQRLRRPWNPLRDPDKLVKVRVPAAAPRRLQCHPERHPEGCPLLADRHPVPRHLDVR